MAIANAPAAARGPRFAVIDLVRGAALGAMIVYHAAFDLSINRLIPVDVVGDLGWRIFARLIAGTFLLLVGVNLVLATRHGLRLRPFLRRLGLIAGAALLVTVGTWYWMPETFVFFGILHCIAVSSVLALPFLRLPSIIVALAAALVIAAPAYLASSFFDPPFWWWLGLSTVRPLTIDFVPILPWFGLVLAGVVVGRLFLAYSSEGPLAQRQPSGAIERVVTTAGRWSLPIYLIHQPVLIGIVSLMAIASQPSAQELSERFLTDCLTNCRNQGGLLEVCGSSCGCVLTKLKETDLLAVAMEGSMNDVQQATWRASLNQCLPKPLTPPQPATPQ